MASLFDGTEDMDCFGEIYRRIETNCPNPSSKSGKLWELRREIDVKDQSSRKVHETWLEKAVAMLAERGHMPEWFNQCPTASGIVDSYADRRRDVDLVHWCEATGHARLIELKWGSNDPPVGIRQILRYGAAYVFCRMHKDKLPVRHRPVMNARHVSLCVAAPAQYYKKSDPSDCLTRARESLKRFDIGSRIAGLSMSLDVLALPDWFDAPPFSSGAEVRSCCDRKELTDTGRRIRDAFEGLSPYDRKRKGGQQ